MNINKVTLILCTFILSIGILGAGYSIGKGMYLVRKMSRIVTVKGLAEQDVKSDLGLFEINFREVGNDLIQLDQRLQHDFDVLIAFLKQQGFTDDEMSRNLLRVEDRLASDHSESANVKDQRYVISSGIRLRSTKIDVIQKVVQSINKLLQQGIPLNFNTGMSGLYPNPSFYYTQLDRIRPAMLAKATQSSRLIAEQFAKDSNTQLAGIVRASQGVFQIMGRDTSTMNSDWNSNENALGSIDKKVRLVTTIDYRLK